MSHENFNPPESFLFLYFLSCQPALLLLVPASRHRLQGRHDDDDDDDGDGAGVGGDDDDDDDDDGDDDDAGDDCHCVGSRDASHPKIGFGE